jgi:hypothetical protein
MIQFYQIHALYLAVLLTVLPCIHSQAQLDKVASTYPYSHLSGIWGQRRRWGWREADSSAHLSDVGSNSSWRGGGCVDEGVPHVERETAEAAKLPQGSCNLLLSWWEITTEWEKKYSVSRKEYVCDYGEHTLYYELFTP